MIFRFSSPVLLTGWEVFHQLILCPVFLLSLPIIGLGGFSPATWSFETHQLSCKARMFLLVSQFSSSVSLIGFGGFLPGSHSKFPFKVPFQGSHSTFFLKFRFNKFHAQRSLRLKREAIVITWPSERKAFEAEVMWQLPTTTSIHPVWLPSRRLVPPHLRHRVGGMSIYKSEGYSVATDAYQVWYKMTKKSRWWWQRPRRMMMNGV